MYHEQKVRAVTVQSACGFIGEYNITYKDEAGIFQWKELMQNETQNEKPMLTERKFDILDVNAIVDGNNSNVAPVSAPGAFLD
jgi:hypothetical protein